MVCASLFLKGAAPASAWQVICGQNWDLVPATMLANYRLPAMFEEDEARKMCMNLQTAGLSEKNGPVMNIEGFASLSHAKAQDTRRVLQKEPKQF